MKFNRVLFLALAALVSTLLAACGPVPLTNWPGLASDGKNVYLADGQFVYTVQVSDGKEVKVQAADGNSVPLRFPATADGNVSIYGAPALTTDGQMIVGNASAQTNVHHLYSVDPTNDTQKWFFETPSVWLAGPITHGDAIYAANGNGKVYAFDLKGKKLWEAVVSKDALWTSPVTDGKTVYAATLAHDLVALDAATGNQLWKKTLDNAIIGAPALVDGKLYVGTLSGNLYAFDATEGNQLWLAQLQGSIWSTPVLDGTTLYVGTSNETAGKLFAIDATNGKSLRSPLDETGAIIASPLVLKDQIVYVTEDGYINFIDKNGVDSFPAVKIDNAKLYTTPMLVGDLILVAPMHTEFVLAAYNQKGVQQWKFIPTK
jgi:outer membrane protein assembly factor BamB